MMRSLRAGASIAAVLVTGLAVVGCEPAPEGDPPGPIGTVPVGAADVQLVAFDSCESALREFQDAAVKEVGPYGLGDNPNVIYDQGGAPTAAESGAAGEAKAAPQQAPEHSSTNVHEANADEPDLVKTDGKRIVSALDENKLRVVDVASREVTATVDLDGEYPTGLFLHGDRALVISPGGTVGPAEGREAPEHYAERLQLLLVDLTGEGRIIRRLTVDGGYVDARATDGTARVVIRSGPRLEWTQPAGPHSEGAATARNKEIIRESSISDWLPRYTLTAGGTEQSGRLVDCARVSHPKPTTGASLLTVLTLDIGGKLDRGDPVSVTANGGTVYGTGDTLYVADDSTGFNRGRMPTADIASPVPPEKQQTKVYQFDTTGSGPPEFVASGLVDGDLLNQYSMSEHDGHLRIATTKHDWTSSGRDNSRSAVYVLERAGEELKQVGSVGGLGKGEQIYSVRFLGDIGYVVTFRQTDPLYRIDLSDPANPQVDGELKITGYSAYLHPVGVDRLLGIGQEASTEGRITGMQVSLFDIGDAKPQRLSRLHVKGGSSDAEHDPHAFLYWPQRDLVVVPMRVYDTTGIEKPEVYQGASALVLRVSGDRVERVGAVRHPAGDADAYRSDIRRSLVVGDTLWTLSSAGVQANDLDTLDRRAFVRFN
jgi:hypothetical protein